MIENFSIAGAPKFRSIDEIMGLESGFLWESTLVEPFALRSSINFQKLRYRTEIVSDSATGS